MVIHPKLRIGIDAVRFVLRFFLYVTGLGAVAWGTLLLPYFWHAAPLTRLTAELVAGQTFALQTISDESELADSIGRFCDPTRVHDAVILRLAALEQTIKISDEGTRESAYDRLYDAIGTALACSPADGFVWLTMFWLEVSRHGYQPTYGNYLRLSYTLTPYEGWIAVWRNKLAIALLDKLPSDLSQRALEEFTRLVETERLYPESMAIFAEASPANQIRLAQQLKMAKPAARQAFARMLYDHGSDVTIPGVDAAPRRPWR